MTKTAWFMFALAACKADQIVDDAPVAMCGNGVLDPGETCDPPGSCEPCDDGNACTVDLSSGGMLTCDLACTREAITGCADGDGCCPATCELASDSDCSASCGNGVVDPSETCDPPASCPTACDDLDACTFDVVTGSAANCNATCAAIPITTCMAIADGCCPSGCSAQIDADLYDADCMP